MATDANKELLAEIGITGASIERGDPERPGRRGDRETMLPWLSDLLGNDGSSV